MEDCVEQPAEKCTDNDYIVPDELTERVEELKQQVQHWYQEAKKWYQKVTELSKFFHTKLDDSNERIVALTIENNSLVTKNASLCSEKDAILLEKDQLLHILALVTNEFSTLESDYNKLMKHCEEISLTIMHTKDKNRQLEREMNDLKLQVQQVAKELDTVKINFTKAMEDLKDSEEARQKLINQNSELNSQLLDVKRKLENMEQVAREFDALKVNYNEAMKDSEEARQKLMNQNSELNSQLLDVKLKLENMGQENKKLLASLATWNHKYEELEQQSQKQEHTINTLKQLLKEAKVSRKPETRNKEQFMYNNGTQPSNLNEVKLMMVRPRSYSCPDSGARHSSQTSVRTAKDLKHPLEETKFAKPDEKSDSLMHAKVEKDEVKARMVDDRSSFKLKKTRRHSLSTMTMVAATSSLQMPVSELDESIQ